MLHLGEQVAEVLGVEAAPAAGERRARPSGTVSVASASTRVDVGQHRLAQRGRVDATPSPASDRVESSGSNSSST